MNPAYVSDSDGLRLVLVFATVLLVGDFSPPDLVGECFAKVE